MFLAADRRQQGKHRKDCVARIALGQFAAENAGFVFLPLSHHKVSSRGVTKYLSLLKVTQGKPTFTGSSAGRVKRCFDPWLSTADFIRRQQNPSLQRKLHQAADNMSSQRTPFSQGIALIKLTVGMRITWAST